MYGILSPKASRGKAGLVQWLQFGAVGFLNVFIAYAVYAALIFFDLDYLAANFVGFSLGMVNACYWNRNYVFAGDEKQVWWKIFAKTYIAYASTGILLGSILLYVWIELFRVSAFWAPMINLFVTFPINFILNKHWVYRQ